MANRLKKWIRHEFSTVCCAGEDYLAFQKDARADLRKQASTAGYKLHKFNKNHYCFSAVLLDEETRNYIYISVGDVRCGRRWYEEVLYRTLDGRPKPVLCLGWHISSTVWNEDRESL